jgi:hypothetical protein
MKCPRELRSEAERYRRLVAGVDDRRAIEAITELAAEVRGQQGASDYAPAWIVLKSRSPRARRQSQ